MYHPHNFRGLCHNFPANKMQHRLDSCRENSEKTVHTNHCMEDITTSSASAASANIATSRRFSGVDSDFMIQPPFVLSIGKCG